jgi:hypothetical protein
MLTELCQELRNWFERDKYFGTFTIEGGQLTDSSFLQEGQYYRIVGSVFNDGVHKLVPDDTLHDEVFDGAIWAMAVPPAVIALSDEIDEWRAKYETADSAAMSPFNSESFGGYSYSKSGGGTGNSGGNAPATTWKAMFANSLNRWRKI